MAQTVPKGIRLLEVTRFSRLDLKLIRQAFVDYLAEVGEEKCRDIEKTMKVLAERLKMKPERCNYGCRIAVIVMRMENEMESQLVGKCLLEILEVKVLKAPDYPNKNPLKIISRLAGRLDEVTIWEED